jgi:hypothetical protein
VKWIATWQAVTDDNAFDAEVTYTGAATTIPRRQE